MRLTVARVAPRDGRACAHCGATDGLSIQHRANKGMGGSKLAERLSNGVILCATFNSRLEQDAELADLARRMGWKVSKYRLHETHTIPYWHHPTGAWWIADDDGHRRNATRQEVVEHLDRLAA